MVGRTALIALLLSALSTIGYTPLHAQGIMTTWIGSGAAGNSGNGGLPGSASINAPHDVCFDIDGNCYFTDQANNLIKQVSAATGCIYIIAGCGLEGHIGDGGPAPQAELNRPAYICTNTVGDIYFTDAGNNAIRYINAVTRTILSLAGDSPAGFSGDSSYAFIARLNNPQGLCFDAAGNLYFADAGNNRIRKIDTTGIITTIAGNATRAFTGDGGPATAASLNNPTAIAFDLSGNLYIADAGNFVIRRITKTTGIITSIAGNGTSGFSGNGGLALCASIGRIDGLCIDRHGDIYINDSSSCRKISMATGNISLVAGNGKDNGYNGDGGAAITELLSAPASLCVDPPTGNIIIADAGNNRIRIATQPDFVPAPTTVIEAPTMPAVFPNPSSGKFAIQAGIHEQNAHVAIYNAAGELVYKTTLTGTLNTFDLSYLPPGIYFAHIRSAGPVETIKMEIK